MKSTLIALAFAAAAASMTSPVLASDQAQQTAQVSPTGMKAQTSADMTEGEVRKIDKESQKITLRHGEIKNLGMPGMTMVFKVKEAGALDAVQVGSKVRFTAEKVDGALVVTAMEVAQ